MPQPIGTTNEATRHDWVRAQLSAVPAGVRLLDAGAGMQPYRAACDHLDYVAHDFAEYDGAGDGRGGQIKHWDNQGLDLVSDITGIPVPDASFDAVLCTEVIEHVPDPVAALRELTRVLRPGGRLILTAPFVSNTHFSPYHFCTGFNRYFYEKHLSELGMGIDIIETNGSYFASIAQEVRRIPQMAEKYANSRPNWLTRLATRVLLRGLSNLEQSDRGSSEYLAFGLHVSATKKAQTNKKAA
ncbi:MAG: methyltransferase domain-containing protein [Planctomycetota bacterium]